MTDCVGTKMPVEGLKPRKPKGLVRPKKEIAGLGTIEKVRDERCHSWRIDVDLIATRKTTIDEVLLENEEPAVAAKFVTQLRAQEKELRSRFVVAVTEHLTHPATRRLALGDLRLNLDEWVAPYRVTRSPDGNGAYLYYDCSDAPAPFLLNASLFNVSVDRDWSICGFSTFYSDVAWDRRVEAFRQRVIPADCGFIEDCVADKLISYSFLSMTPALEDLFKESVAQITALREKAAKASEPFFTAALTLLAASEARAIRPE